MSKTAAGTSPAITVNDQQAVAAEQRVNVVRIAAIAVFYFIHFLHASGPKLNEVFPSITVELGDPVPESVHDAITILCMGWLMQCFLVSHRISRGRVSAWFGLGVTVGDLAWLTALLSLSRGPASPMVAGYFLIIMLTGIRFDLRLTRYSTVAAGIAYLVLLGVARWPLGLLKEINLETVPRYHQVMTLIAIILSGVIVGQIVRHAYLIGKSVDQAQKENNEEETLPEQSAPESEEVDE